MLAGVGIAGCFSPDGDQPPELGDDGTSGDTRETDDGPVATTGTASNSSENSSDSGEHEDASSGSTDAPGETGETGATGDPNASTCGNGLPDAGEQCDDGNDEDADACSNACVANFHTGSLEPCSEHGQTMCGYFEAECRRDPEGGELAQLCYWEQSPSQEACDGTPGIWTPPDSPFAVDSGFDFPLAGACITQIGNLQCPPVDAQACAEVGGSLCFRELGPGGEDLDLSSLCWWDADENGCEATPGVWTTADSGFGQGHPNALPPSDTAVCVLQVDAL